MKEKTINIQEGSDTTNVLIKMLQSKMIQP